MDPFDEINIGDCRIKNRIAMAPMISNLAGTDGNTNEVHTSYLAERAKGGYGLIITEYSFVPSIRSRGSRNQLSFARQDQIPGFKRLSETVHGYGSKIFAQLVHAGGKAITEKGDSPLAPSPVEYMGSMAQELTTEQINDIAEAFSVSASIAEKSGFDGIELHGAHGYLIHEFLSPALNSRKDRYGGSFEAMLTFPKEIIKRVRESVSIPVGIRLSLYEDDADGYTPEHGIRVAESLKGLDYIHFSAGRNAPPGSSAPFYYPKANIAQKIFSKPGIPTMVVGSITDRDSLHKALEFADMVSMGRGALADPFFPEKIRKGMIPRPCIRCNQGCRDLAYGQVRCTINYSTGRETLVPSYTLDGEVTIAGAGAAGMEAAIYLARCGMKVTVLEKTGEIGGQLNDIKEERHFYEFHRIVEYYKYEAERLGVVIKFHTEAKPDQVDLWLADGKRYDSIPTGKEIYVDSLAFSALDEAITLSGNSRITMTERSLTSMDRSRQAVYREMALKKGIVFMKEPDEKLSSGTFQGKQEDLGSAVRRGVSEAIRYAGMKIH